jgi:hypothetical protein
MTSDWQEAYSKLKDFITENPAVEIEPSRVHLPDEVRPGFYRLFDAVRTALIEEKLPALVGEAELLSQNYTRVEAEVVALLGLEGVSTSLPLHGFLHSPMKELRRGAFDPLFDLLKGRIATEAFVERVLQNVEASFWSLYQLGYEKWALLSLVKLLGADKLFQTVLPKLTLYDAHKKGGGLRQEVPPVEESKRLSFKLDASEAFVTPDLIVHSTTANKYISIRSQIKQSFTAAVNPNDKREWYPLSSFTAIEPSLTLVVSERRTGEDEVL